jgi:hypothetical protein
MPPLPHYWSGWSLAHFLPMLVSNCNPPNLYPSSPQVAGITELSHHTWLHFCGIVLQLYHISQISDPWAGSNQETFKKYLQYFVNML